MLESCAACALRQFLVGRLSGPPRAVERPHSWKNLLRRIFTRSAKKAASYLGRLLPVCAIITHRCAKLLG
jgi:hypothetical protein